MVLKMGLIFFVQNGFLTQKHVVYFKVYSNLHNNRDFIWIQEGIAWV